MLRGVSNTQHTVQQRRMNTNIASDTTSTSGISSRAQQARAM